MIIFKELEVNEIEHFWEFLNTLDVETNCMMYEPKERERCTNIQELKTDIQDNVISGNDFLQIAIDENMSNHRIPKTYELFFCAQDKMRCKQMYFLRYVQAYMPNECGCNRQFEEPREWDRVYSVLRMCKELPEGCFVDGRAAVGGEGVLESIYLTKGRNKNYQSAF